MNSLSKFNNVEDDKGNKREALQFMFFDKHGDTNFPFFFDSKLLKDIWTAKDVADLQIALLSVGGKYRTGKTFLLNLFVHLLQFGTFPENLDLNDTTSGFQWQGGSTAVTDGIWIINKPFILEKLERKTIKNQLKNF